MDLLISVLFLFCLIVSVCLLGGRGKPLHADTKELVFRIHEYFESECEDAKYGRPLTPVTNVWERTTKATGLSRSVVGKILHEKRTKGILDSPAKKRPRESKKTNVDNFNREALRRLVLSLYKEGFIPSLKDILDAIEKNLDELKLSRWSLWKIMHDIGFRYKTNDSSRKFLMEQTNIIAKRNEYLYTVKDARKTGRPIIFLDETWVNVNLTREKMWIIKDDKEGLRIPIGKGSRIIVVHAGNEAGFVKDALLVFQSKSTKDYHEEMDSDRFLKWFKEQLIPNIPPNSFIVMDNASYHSRELNKAPTSNSRKADMQEWLREKGIVFDDRMVKPKLYEIIKLHKPQFRTYEIDKIAKDFGHCVIRLPPYHCEFNPIELIWAQVKDYVRKRNTKFTMGHLLQVFHDGVNSVTAERWRDACGKAEKIEKFYWERDQLTDRITDQFVINLEVESDEDDLEEEKEEDKDNEEYTAPSLDCE